MGAVNVHAIQKQHMKMDVQVQRAAKALDQGDGAGVCAESNPDWRFTVE